MKLERPIVFLDIESTGVVLVEEFKRLETTVE